LRDTASQSACGAKRGGAAAILEFVPHEDRVSPSKPVRFNLTALGGIPVGDA